MLNHITLQGRLTRDVELRRTNSGTAVASFTLAVEDDYSQQDGKRNCNFINCVAWKGTGEFVEKWFHKGDMMLISGRLTMRNYEDKNGNKRTAAEVVVSNIYFCGSKKASAETDAAPQQYDELLDNDNDLPF